MAKSYRTHISPGKAAKSRLMPKPLAKDEFARRLYQAMLEKGWRQADLARAAGLQRNAVSVYLRGASLPSPENLEKLAKALGKRADELLPNYVESAIEKDNPEIDMKVSPGDPKSAWLRINRLMSTSLAIKILNMIEQDDAGQATDGA